MTNPFPGHYLYPWELATARWATYETNSWYPVRRNSPQDHAWRDYFKAYGWRPFLLRVHPYPRIYNMPCQWPHDLPEDLVERIKVVEEEQKRKREVR